MSYLDDLITVQNDAFDNLYDIAITLPAALTANISDIHLRVRAGDITIPEAKVDEYPIAYKTIEIKKPKPKIIMDRKLAVPFRVDANYEVYKLLRDWGELVYSDDGSYNPLDAGKYGKITISAYNSAEDIDSVLNTAVKWTFENVWFGGFDTGPALKRGGGDPVSVVADFKFFKKITL